MASRNRTSAREDRNHQHDPSPHRTRSERVEEVEIYGFHAVLAALKGRRRKLHGLQATAAAAARLAPEIAAAGLPVKIVTTEDLARRLGQQAVHQGVLLLASPIEPIDLVDIEDHSGLILVLDQITDPHNVGAILRTAAAFAADAIVTTERHSPALSGVLAKAACGGLDHVPIATVVNLARALEELTLMGYWRVGFDSDGDTTFEAAPIRRPLALVFGAEDKGLRRLTRENCDAVVRLDMPGAIKSLNVSNACAIALVLARQRLAAL